MKDKLYLFFTYDVANVGGVQLYMRAKALWLIERGWEVKIIHSVGGKILIMDYEQLDRLFLPEFFFPAYFYWNKKRERILSRVVGFIDGNYSEIIVESHSYCLATWGEIIAQRTGVKHFVYIIDENPIVDALGQKYLEFKYNRGEVAGIVEETIPKLLNNTGFVLSKGNCKLIAYHCNDCIIEAPFTPFIKNNGYNIGLIGRLEKEYMKDTPQELITFLQQHENVHFNVVYVGGEKGGDNIKGKLQKHYANSKNVDVYFTGFMFPIVKGLIHSFDVCISGAGTAWALTCDGLTTIVVDPRDCFSSGVLGITTKSALFCEEEKKPISYWLNEVYTAKEKYLPQREERTYIGYKDHFAMIENSSKVKEYNTDYLYSKGAYLVLQKFVCSVFSPSFVMKMLNLKAKLHK
jgi:hypothetical protein